MQNTATLNKAEILELLQKDSVQVLLCEVDLREIEPKDGFRQYERTGTYQIVIRDTSIPLENIPETNDETAAGRKVRFVP